MNGYCMFGHCRTRDLDYFIMVNSSLRSNVNVLRVAREAF
jgi:hypothetical protein